MEVIVLNSIRSIQTALLIIHPTLAMEFVAVVQTTQPECLYDGGDCL